MSPEEASQKWCPMARNISGSQGPETVRIRDGQTAFNRVLLDTTDAASFVGKCIADQCMMWRRFPPILTSESEIAQHGRPDHPGGYCGLAGKPELSPMFVRERE